MMRAAMALFAIVAALGIQAFGQRGPARGKEELNPADAEMETTAKHDLEVARYYLEKRKAYTGARDRLRGIIDTYPDFTKTHEVLYYLGETDQKLGKTEEAIISYRRLVKNYPASDFVKKARERLSELKAPEDGPVDLPPEPKPVEAASDKPKGDTGRPSIRLKPSPTPPPE
jgi:tetratricopeptide (TPR) repeat protein